MGEALKLLLIEDDESDQVLIVRELKRAGFAPETVRVSSAAALVAALDGEFDLALTDYTMPGFDGMSALGIVRKIRPNLPVIVVSGMTGEERAVEMMRAGARDFVLKDRLSLLGPAIRRELEEHRDRAALARETQRRRDLFEASTAGLIEFDATAYLAEVRRLLEGAEIPLDRARDAMGRLGLVELALLQVTVLSASAEAQRLLALPTDLPVPLSAIVRPGSRAALQQIVAMVLAGGGRFLHELELEALDARTLRVVLGAHLPGLESADGWLVLSLQDVTELRQLERDLRVAQRLESIGRLAGGVAHDFNNLLAVIGLHASMARRTCQDPDLLEDLSVIDETMQRGAELTRQLLAFARQSPDRPIAVDVVEAIQRFRKLLERALGEGTVLTADLDPGTGNVFVGASHIEQIVMNLAVNARDAMPLGGRLRISAYPRRVDAETDLGIGGRLGPGEYAVIAVEDEGTGMDEATRLRIFEPFFTTKEPGRGTGLGLATVFGIVSKAGGAIRVDSQPGRGSRFEIHLPRTDRALEQPEATTPFDEEISDGRILVVDDDPRLRSVMKRILQRSGYVVVDAASGTEALRLAEGQRFDLVISDMVMPGVRGSELARRLVASGVARASLLVSGYLPDGPEDVDDWLPKPFTDRVLLERVRAAIEAR